MDDFKYQLVLQLPGTATHDFEMLIALEDVVAGALEETPHHLDGHDFGSGTGNIFIDTNDPIAAFALAREAVSLAEYPTLRAGYRSFDEDDYRPLWPEDSTEPFDLI